MMNYAWDISQSETEKYFEWTIIAFIEVMQSHLFLVGKKDKKKMPFFSLQTSDKEDYHIYNIDHPLSAS